MSQIETLQNEIQNLKSQLLEQKKSNEKLLKRLEQTTSADTSPLPLAGENSNFWANISHEILAPMDGILGITDLVLETKLSSEQRDYLEMVSSSADRLLEVVNDILDYTRLEAGKMELDSHTFNLFEELEYDLFLSRLEARNKDIELRYNFDKSLPTMVQSDGIRLRQVLSNLVSNAIKYTDEGEVTVNVVNEGYDENDNLIVKFLVTDTGIGISERDQPQIFESLGSSVFKQTDKLSGVGLGLVVSAKIIKLIGGEMGLESKPEQGSTFWFTWLLRDMTSSHGVSPNGVQRDQQEINFVLQGAKILLAEDEKISATVTQAFLEQMGVEVTVVSNGKAAVEMVKKGEKCNILLMDVEMPVVDGLEATQSIRSFEKKQGGHLPIIALTAHALHGDKERCLQAGMNDYLTKPLDKSQLLNTLTKYLTPRVLVVGGEPKNQQVLVKALVESGWSVTIAETGRLAKYEASLSNFDLIIIDIMMVGDESVETARTIRKLEEFTGYNAAIIGIGESMVSNKDHFTASGFDSYITFPVSFEELKEKFTALKDGDVK